MWPMGLLFIHELTFHTHTSVACNLWVAGLSLASVLLFISFVKFQKCILEANVTDFEILKIRM